MVAPGPDSPLSTRLRHARLDAGATQKDVAQALGVSVAGISSWESIEGPKVPEPDRLTRYAAFLAERLGQDPDALTAELLQLRERARRAPRRGRAATGRTAGDEADSDDDDAGGIWAFRTRLPITIICSRTPESLLDAIPWARQGHPNYIRILGMAEADAALSLNGYLRLHNPTVSVNLGTPDELRPDQLTGHVVMLGRQDWATLGGPMLDRLGIPVELSAPGAPGGPEEFEGTFGTKDDGRVFGPTLQEVPGGEYPMLIDDVALLARGPSPLNSAATVTVCTGLFHRGTTGLIKATTDRYLATANHQVLADQFDADGGSDGSFALLARVNVVDQLTPPVDLSVPGVLEWSWRA